MVHIRHFNATPRASPFPGLGGFCATANHWSDDVTSRGYIKDIVVPYFKRTIEAMRKTDLSSCKPFGVQHCVLIIDVWWGWLNADLREWIRREYKWIKLIFVPASCTPVAQPMDRGVIAMIKGYLRKRYSTWAVDLITQQINSGTDESNVNLPSDVPTCKKNLFCWLSDSVENFSNQKQRVVHCWNQTELMKAWDASVQNEALMRAGEVFPNMVRAELVRGEADEAAPDVEDNDAFYEGDPFLVAEDEEEWVGWVDGEAEPAAAAEPPVPVSVARPRRANAWPGPPPRLP